MAQVGSSFVSGQQPPVSRLPLRAPRPTAEPFAVFMKRVPALPESQRAQYRLQFCGDGAVVVEYNPEQALQLRLYFRLLEQLEGALR